MALQFISADDGCVSLMMELLNKRYYFFINKAWPHYVGVPTLRIIAIGVLKIGVSCLNNPFMELSFEPGMQLPTRD